MKPSKELSAEQSNGEKEEEEEKERVEDAGPSNGRRDSASCTADKPEDEQNEALGENCPSSSDGHQTDDPSVPDDQADAKCETPLEKTVTVMVTAATAGGGDSADSGDRVQHPLEDASGEEKSQTETQPQASGDEDEEDSSEEEKDAGDEKQEKEADEKEIDQMEVQKSTTDGGLAKQTKRSKKKKKRKRKRNNNAAASKASQELPFPTPATNDQSESSPQKQRVSYAGAVKSGTSEQRERNVNI